MNTDPKSVLKELIAACFTLSACCALSNVHGAGLLPSPEPLAATPRTEPLLAQMRGGAIGTTPVLPPVVHPPVVLPPVVLPPVIQPPVLLPPVVLPGPIIPGPGGGPPSYHQVRGLVPACVVASTSAAMPGDCSTRFINHHALYDDFRVCSTGQCFASRFLDIAKAPVVVVYPQATEARAVAQAQLRTEMVAGVRAMGSVLRERAGSGNPGLPSLSGIDDLVGRAIDEVGRINQPVDESMNERLRRLGLGSAARHLAQTVRNS